MVQHFCVRRIAEGYVVKENPGSQPRQDDRSVRARILRKRIRELCDKTAGGFAGGEKAWQSGDRIDGEVHEVDKQDDGTRREILSFGSISVHPDFQRLGLGKRIMAHSFAAAKALGYKAVVIFGNPENYVSSGFKCSRRFNVSMDGNYFPTALLCLEMNAGLFDGRHYVYRESDVVTLLDDEKVEEFDRSFPPKEKGWMPSQEKFYIYSHSSVGE